MKERVNPPEMQDISIPKITMIESKYIFHTIIFGIYVGFRGCKLCFSYHIVVNPSKVGQQKLSNISEVDPIMFVAVKSFITELCFNGPTNNCFKQQKIKTAKRWAKP